jgi:hypothetical protein
MIIDTGKETIRAIEEGYYHQLRCEGERNSYVYELAYPESMGGKVFYIGKGTKWRINEHEGEARKGIRSVKCDIICDIWARGEQVTKRKVYEGLCSAHAFIVEQELIYRKGFDELSNLEVGAKLKKQKHHIVPSVIPIEANFRRDIDEQIRHCMEVEGIQLTKGDCRDYLREICKNAILEHISKFS